MPSDSDVSADFRLSVIKDALDLFAVKGYEATSVDEIAEKAGISRRTFFRQFRAKEDVVFADHEILLDQAAHYLSKDHDDPWLAVCEAALLVFERFSGWKTVSQLRYRVVRDIPALRDREIVTVFRYERLFVDYLRTALPQHPHLDVVQFAATVTATHNYALRRVSRDTAASASTDLRGDLEEVRIRFGVGPSLPDAGARGPVGSMERDDEIVVAVFPRGVSRDKVHDLLSKHLD